MRTSVPRPLGMLMVAASLVAALVTGTSAAQATARTQPAHRVPLRVSPGGTASTAGVPAATPAGSLVYYLNGNIWVAAADGSGAHQVTTGGNWLWSSMDDSGTIVAEGPGETAPDGSQGMDLYVMNQSGTVNHKITTPSDYSTFSFPAYPPNTVRVSPDGSKIAYWNWEGGEQTTLWTPTTSTNLNFPGQSLGQENDENPAWIDNTHLVLDDPSAWGCFFSPPTAIIRTYQTGRGDDTSANWFDDTAEEGTDCYKKDGWASDYSPTISRAGDKLAIFDSDSGLQGGSPSKVAIRLFTVTSTTVKPTFKCEVSVPAAGYNFDNGLWVGYASPTFSPDGTELAWGEKDGIHVANVSNLNSCSTITQSLLIPGGALAFFSPAGQSGAKASITLSPKKGPAGSTVTVTGSGFGASEVVSLSFTDSAKHKTALGQVTTNAGGAFSKTVTIPAGAPGGKGKVIATGGTSGRKASKAFTVT